MGILPILLFVLGVIFLFLGWRWQSPSNEEAMTALKGFAHLKSEMLRVQNQVHVLEDKIHRVTQVERKEVERKEVERKEVERKEVERKEVERKEVERKEVERKEVERKEVEHKEAEHKEVETECNEKCKLYSLHVTDQRERNSGVEIMPLGEERVNQSGTNSVPQPNRKISSKYQEVLELAKEGQPIAKISQSLLLSQDAVMMILRMHQKGENQ